VEILGNKNRTTRIEEDKIITSQGMMNPVISGHVRYPDPEGYQVGMSFTDHGN
jgi:hypothetical protein